MTRVISEEGIILHTRPYRETSLLVKVITKNYGLITGVAKGTRGSKRGNILQQYEDVDFTLNNIIANNDYLMIKGSNATGLNNFSKKLIKGS